MFNGQNPFGGSDEKSGSANTADNLPLSTVSGSIKSSAPEFTLRTRIWVSFRARTLYRTVSGMMNYAKAIKLLYRVENPEVVQFFGRDSDKLERELERMARWKFDFVFSIFLCNVIQISTLLNVRMPSSCYVLTLICRLLILTRNHHDVKVARQDCSLL